MKFKERNLEMFDVTLYCKKKVQNTWTKGSFSEKKRNTVMNIVENRNYFAIQISKSAVLEIARKKQTWVVIVISITNYCN